MRSKQIRRSFKVGVAQNFRPGPTWKENGPLSFTICLEDGQVWKRHMDHIKFLHKEVITEFTSTEDDEAACTESTTEGAERTPHYPQRIRFPTLRYGTFHLSEGGV